MHHSAILVLLFLSFICNSQQDSDFTNALSKLNTTKIKFNPIKPGFQACNTELNSDDTLRYCLGKYGLQYSVIQNDSLPDFMELNTKKKPVLINHENQVIAPKILINSSECYSFKAFRRKYILFISGGQGLLQSGSFQNIRFFTIIDITKKASWYTHSFWSITSDLISLGDFDNDNKLDFLQVFYGNEMNNEFQTILYDVHTGLEKPQSRNKFLMDK